MKIFKHGIVSAVIFTILHSTSSFADTYVIDDSTMNSHAFVQFRVKHLGFSWLWGRFDNFSGEFTYDPNKPEASTVSVTLDTTSLNSNNALRDKHLKSEKYLNFSKYSTATFVSTRFSPTGENTATLTGNLTLAGVTKPLSIDVEVIGGGTDPWGGTRQGFEGRALLNPQDFGLTNAAALGEAGTHVELYISVEGVKK